MCSPRLTRVFTALILMQKTHNALGLTLSAIQDCNTLLVYNTAIHYWNTTLQYIIGIQDCNTLLQYIIAIHDWNMCLPYKSAIFDLIYMTAITYMTILVITASGFICRQQLDEQHWNSITTVVCYIFSGSGKRTH